MPSKRLRKSNSYDHANITEPTTVTDRAARQLAADAAEFQKRKRSHKKAPSPADADNDPPPKKTMRELGDAAFDMIAQERRRIEEKTARLRTLREQRDKRNA